MLCTDIIFTSENPQGQESLVSTKWLAWNLNYKQKAKQASVNSSSQKSFLAKDKIMNILAGFSRMILRLNIKNKDVSLNLPGNFCPCCCLMPKIQIFDRKKESSTHEPIFQLRETSRSASLPCRGFRCALTAGISIQHNRSKKQLLAY